MAIEQKLPAVPPRAFVADGTQQGTITLVNTQGFKVKQSIIVGGNTLPQIRLQIKRASRTQLIVGPIPTQQGEQSLTTRTDLSAYTVALNSYVFAEEQTKVKIKPDDIIQAVYRQEPGTTIGVEIDDQYGNPIDSIIDSEGVNRLAVDGQFHAEVDVEVDVDGYYDAIDNPNPDNVGLIGHTRAENPDETDQIQRITTKQGTTDTDTRSMDVAIHDHDGNSYTPDNPVPVVSVGSAADKGWDDLVLVRDPGTKEIVQAIYKKNTITVRTLDLTYDTDVDLIRVEKS